jgi:hypothetical protein
MWDLRPKWKISMFSLTVVDLKKSHINPKNGIYFQNNIFS